MPRDYDTLAAQLDSKAPRQVRAVDIGEFLALELPPRKSLLKPVLPEQGLVMIHGPRGLGKTHLSVGISVAVATAGRLMRWEAERPAGVLLVDGEMPATTLQERLSAAIKMGGKEPGAPLRIVTPDLQESG